MELGNFSVSLAVKDIEASRLFYEKLGLAVLKKAWFNIDFAWALALIATGVVLLFM